MKINLLYSVKIFAGMNFCITFVCNNTCHASHKNSAPGQVFDFYGATHSYPTLYGYTTFTSLNQQEGLV